MPKILLVDDNANNLDLLKIRLQAECEASHILTASNGQEAVDIAQSQTPDCILMDVMMPIMDGKEACRIIKQDQNLRHIPVILLTAMKTDVDSRVEGVEAGADEYVTKPINFKELLSKLRAHIRVKILHDELQEAHNKLREVERYKSGFIEKMSRDLEGPISGLIRELKGIVSAGPLNEKQEESWGIAQANTELLQQLVSKMLSVTRLEQNLISSKPEKFDPVEVLQEVIMTDNPLIDQKQISFMLEADQGVQVFADKGMCREMLANLVQVAIRFSEPDEDIIVFCRKENFQIKGGVTFINPELSQTPIDETIFEKFAQLDIKSELMAQLDLELPLVRLLAKEMHGSVHASADSGVESVTIGFNLPAGA